MMSQPASACTTACRQQDCDGLVVGDIAVADHAVMAVRGERVERHVAQDADFGHRLLQRGDGAADEIAGVERLAAFGVLQRRRHRRKHRDRRDAECRGLARGVDQGRDRQPKRARHRRDRLLAPLVMHKDRPDQIARGQHVLGDEPARPRVAPVAAQPEARIGGERRQKLGHGQPSGRERECRQSRRGREPAQPRSRPPPAVVGARGASGDKPSAPRKRRQRISQVGAFRDGRIRA